MLPIVGIDIGIDDDAVAPDDVARLHRENPGGFGGQTRGLPESPTLSRGANGLGGLPVSLAVAIEVSFSLLYHPPPRHAPVAVNSTL
jgi:hypothetical protein